MRHTHLLRASCVKLQNWGNEECGEEEKDSPQHDDADSKFKVLIQTTKASVRTPKEESWATPTQPYNFISPLSFRPFPVMPLILFFFIHSSFPTCVLGYSSLLINLHYCKFSFLSWGKRFFNICWYPTLCLD